MLLFSDSQIKSLPYVVGIHSYLRTTGLIPPAQLSRITGLDGKIYFAMTAEIPKSLSMGGLLRKINLAIYKRGIQINFKSSGPVIYLTAAEYENYRTTFDVTVPDNHPAKKAKIEKGINVSEYGNVAKPENPNPDFINDLASLDFGFLEDINNVYADPANLQATTSTFNAADIIKEALNKDEEINELDHSFLKEINDGYADPAILQATTSIFNAADIIKEALNKDEEINVELDHSFLKEINDGYADPAILQTTTSTFNAADIIKEALKNEEVNLPEDENMAENDDFDFFTGNIDPNYLASLDYSFLQQRYNGDSDHQPNTSTTTTTTSDEAVISEASKNEISLNNSFSKLSTITKSTILGTRSKKNIFLTFVRDETDPFYFRTTDRLDRSRITTRTLNENTWHLSCKKYFINDVHTSYVKILTNDVQKLFGTLPESFTFRDFEEKLLAHTNKQRTELPNQRTELPQLLNNFLLSKGITPVPTTAPVAPRDTTRLNHEQTPHPPRTKEI